jgi:hypothetical protein
MTELYCSWSNRYISCTYVQLIQFPYVVHPIILQANQNLQSAVYNNMFMRFCHY